MTSIKITRGTKDILPQETYYWQVIEDTARKTLGLANYEQIRTPIFENEELFLRSIGENTDIVSKEMYTFTDQGDRKITLRPEGTAGIIRAYIENQLYLNKSPQRLWYFGPMFRYERPQFGRQRQFHQLGIECIGNQDSRSDVEVIDMVYRILNALEIPNLKLCINSIGDFKDRELYKEALKHYMEPYKNNLDHDSRKRLQNNPLRILDTKDFNTQTILKQAPNILDFISDSSLKRFNKVREYLELLGIQYTVDPHLVRGLDYYTHTAFEIKVEEGNNDSIICGGGRYDLLTQQLGGPQTSAVGCAIGIERILTLMNQSKKNDQIDFYIATQGEEAASKSLLVAKTLRDNSFSVYLDLNNINFRKQVKRASKMSAKACIFLGEQECLDRNITVKWLEKFKQDHIQEEKLESYIKYETS